MFRDIKGGIQTMFARTSDDATLLSLSDLDARQFTELADCVAEATRCPEAAVNSLAGKRIGLLFTKTSTRTRASFWRAAVDLGSDVTNFGPNELQLNTGESWRDTGAVFAQYLDGLVVRTNGPIEQMRHLAEGVPATINAMSACEHPTQALSDYATILEHFGTAENIRIGYFGEGNNTAAALAFLFSRVPGVRLQFFMPESYALPDAARACALDLCRTGGGSVSFEYEIPRNPPTVDVIYTTRWQTMGVDHANANWKDDFRPFMVDGELFERFAAGSSSVFMHDLPAVRGDEVSADVLDGPRSIALRQAYHKRTGAMGAMLWSLGHRRV